MQTQRKELNFSGQNIYVGIDVHLKSWSVSILTEHISHKTFSQPADAQALVNYLRNHFPGGIYHTAYEAGFCGFWLHHKITTMGIKNIVVNPADVPTSQKDKVQKTDAVDSRKIADSLRSGILESIHVPSEDNLSDRSLVRTRYSLVKDTVRCKQRIKSFLYFYGIEFPVEFSKSTTHWSGRFIKWLREISMPYGTARQALDTHIDQLEGHRKQLLTVTRKIRDLSLSGKYAENVRLLKTIPGVGPILSITLCAELGNIDRFANTDHLAGYIELKPTCHDSGDKKSNGEMTFRNKDILLSTLIECNWMAIRKDPTLLLKYNKLAQRMEANKAVVRIARSLVNRIYFVLKNQEEYQCGIAQQKERSNHYNNNQFAE